MSNFTQEQITAAKRYFRNAYLNTGCEDDEADDHTEFMWSQGGHSIDYLYNEAERYRDM